MVRYLLVILSVTICGYTNASTPPAAEDGALRKDPAFAKAVRASSGHEDETAYLEFSKLVEKYPGSPLAHALLGYTALQNNSVTEATGHLRTAVRLDPKMDFAWYYLGLALKADQKFEEAVAAFQTATSLDATNASWWNDLGTASLGKGDEKAALAAFQKAVALAPDSSAGAWAGIGKIETGLKDYPAAISALKKAVKLTPNDPQLWKLLAQVYATTGDSASAREAAERSVSLKP